jgi:hypothetical protein
MPTQRGEANPASAGRRAAWNKPHAAMPRRDGQPVVVPISVAMAGLPPPTDTDRAVMNEPEPHSVTGSASYLHRIADSARVIATPPARVTACRSSNLSYAKGLNGEPGPRVEGRASA